MEQQNIGKVERGDAGALELWGSGTLECRNIGMNDISKEIIHLDIDLSHQVFGREMISLAFHE